MSFKTLAEIKAEIAKEKAKQEVERDMKRRAQEKREAQKELFKLKHRKTFGFLGGVKEVGQRFGRGSARLGRALSDKAQEIEARQTRKPKSTKRRSSGKKSARGRSSGRQSYFNNPFGI